MRLLDLEPAWMNHAGKNIAIIFLCPHCVPLGKRTWITCFFKPAGQIPKDEDGDPGDRKLFEEALRKKGESDPAHAAWEVLGCQRDIAWKRFGHDFAMISITPSIDGSKSGHWHGHITDGRIV